MKKRILAVGAANMDFVQKIPRIPSRGETLAVTDGSAQFIPGGRGVKAAAAFAALGMDALLCSRVGSDEMGARLTSSCRAAGIDTRFVAEDFDEPTGVASVIEESGGSRRTVIYPGAGARLCAEDVEEGFTSYPDGAFTSLDTPAEAVIAASRYSARSDVPLFIDACGAGDFPLEKLQRIEIFSPNETETEALCGIRPDSVDTCLKAAVALGKRVRAHHIVLKLGARGAFCYDGKYYNVIPAYKVKVSCIDGAGDAFNAAMCSAYIQQSGNILAAVKFGCLAGALTVTREKEAPPTVGEIRRFAESME